MSAQNGKMRVAVIGAGRMANWVHYPSLASFDDVEIAAICDMDRARLNETAEKSGVEGRYTEYRKMIEEVAPDAVYAIGQLHILYDVWMGCLGEGLNLYIEKPMGITLHQARCLAQLAEEKGCISQVSFQRRNAPMAVKLLDECKKRGPIVHAVCRFYKYAIKPYREARDHMMDDGVHAIDTLRWICGGDVAAIHSTTKRIQVPDINFISAVLEFSTGATGFLINSWSSGRRIFEVEMHAPGVCAEAELEKKGTLYVEGDSKGVEFDAKEAAGSDELHVYGGFQSKSREFIDAVKSNTLPGSHFGDALKTMEVAEKILAQASLAGR